MKESNLSLIKSVLTLLLSVTIALPLPLLLRCQNNTFNKNGRCSMNLFCRSLLFISAMLIVKTLPVTSINKIVVSSQTEVAQYTGPVAEGFLDRLTFANGQNGGAGNGTTFVPFSISGRTIPNDQCRGMAVQPDGCIVLAGRTRAPNDELY